MTVLCFHEMNPCLKMGFPIFSLMKRFFPLVVMAVWLNGCTSSPAVPETPHAPEPIISFTVHPDSARIALFWKNANNQAYGSLSQLIDCLDDSLQILFAMNAGMFDTDLTPHGLYISEWNTLRAPDTVQEAYGNFYLQPNGVFGIDANGKAFVTPTAQYRPESVPRLATQSGPMLLIDGKIHPEFRETSDNLRIRNGVGILPDGSILFAISREAINFYHFATFFRDAGCKDALFLDGEISQCFYPALHIRPENQKLGPMIVVTKKYYSTFVPIFMHPQAV